MNLMKYWWVNLYIWGTALFFCGLAAYLILTGLTGSGAHHFFNVISWSFILLASIHQKILHREQNDLTYLKKIAGVIK